MGFALIFAQFVAGLGLTCANVSQAGCELVKFGTPPSYVLNLLVSYDDSKKGGAAMEYRTSEDLALMQELLGVSRRDLSSMTGVSVPTLSRWAAQKVRPDRVGLEALYGYAYRRGLRINHYKEQFLREDVRQPRIPLFHGAKTDINGPISCARSRENNDFGRGFYCGETFEQAAMFVSGFPEPSVYALTFDPTGLTERRFGVDLDWMLCIALCRGRLEEYRDAPRAQRLLRGLSEADYVVAPIADNRMFQIIDDFADGEITDVQCEHALSATDLGMQHVIRSERAVSALELCERCFLCEPEREAYRALGAERARLGRDKAKAARRQYRGKGRYIEELFDD